MGWQGKARILLRRLGFTTEFPDNWSGWWVALWAITAPGLIVLAFHIPFVWWVAAALLLFLAPEIFSLVKQNDQYPPLTHTIRHFLPNWVAFPLIYFSLGIVGAHWLRFPRALAIGLLIGLLGWLNDHFSVTYAHPDPYPFTHRPIRPGTSRRRMPA
jgi:hypothetical protein